MQSMVIDSNVYYNLRKRYGMGPARAVMHVWNHCHVEEPVNDEDAKYCKNCGSKLERIKGKSIKFCNEFSMFKSSKPCDIANGLKGVQGYLPSFGGISLCSRWL